MQSLYWFSLIVGGGMLLVSLLGDLFGDVLGGHDADIGFGGHDVDFAGGGHEVELSTEGAEGDVAIGAHALTDASGAAASGGHDVQAVRILSLRTVTYFLFGFGATGVLLARLAPAASPLLVAAGSGLCGVLAAGVSVAVFGWVRSTEAGERQGESSFVGLAATVVLPVDAQRSGRILVRRGAREYELRARPFGRDPIATDVGRDVVIVEMREGTALVAPFDAPSE